MINRDLIIPDVPSLFSTCIQGPVFGRTERPLAEWLPRGAVAPWADFIRGTPLAPAINELTVTADGGYFGDMLPPVFRE